MTQRTAEFLGAPVQYGARDLRHTFDELQEGVLGPTHLAVSAGGAGLSVDVAPGVGFVQGDTATDLPTPQQGLYRVHNDLTLNSAQFNTGGIPAANGSNPRIDQIIARVYDLDEGDGSGARTWQLEVLPGTATAGATLDNRNGATALPNSAMRLADVLIPTSAASVLAANIRDRRPWARGYFDRSYQLTGADYSIASSTPAAIDTTNLQRRVECSGKPLRVVFIPDLVGGNANSVYAVVQPRIDGAVTGVGTGGSTLVTQQANVTIGSGPAEAEWVLLPTPGSHLITMYWWAFNGTATIQRGTDYGVLFYLEEILRDPANNGVS